MKRGETFLPIDFCLTAATLAWLAQKCPTVDVDETIELFKDNAAAKAWAYRDWQAAFRNYVRNGAKYGGVIYKNGREHDPRWQPILHEARKYGFREPGENEPPNGYRTAFEMWRATPKPRSEKVVPLAERLPGFLRRA